MATLKSIQSGTTTLPAASTSVTATITAVTTAKSILKFTHIGSGDRNGYHFMPVAGEINSTTQLTFRKDYRGDQGTPQNVTISWFVIEYDTGVTVQRGGTNGITSNTDKDVTISAITTAKSYPTTTWRGSSNYGAGGETMAVATFTSTTNLRLRTYRASASDVTNHYCYWQVIQYDDASVTVYAKSMTTGTSDTQAITSVDMTKAMLAVTAGTNRAGDFSFEPDFLWTVYLSNATTIQFNRTTSVNDNSYFQIYVVVFSDDNKVSRSTISFGTSDTSQTGTVSISDTSKAYINGTSSYQGANMSINGNAAQHMSNMVSSVITNSTTVTGTRYAHNSLAGTFYFEIIEMGMIETLLSSRVIGRGLMMGVMRGVL
jgi:hypothetical protein